MRQTEISLLIWNKPEQAIDKLLKLGITVNINEEIVRRHYLKCMKSYTFLIY